MTATTAAKPLTLVENRGPIEILTLNRPEALNAMSPELADELSAYFQGLQKRRDVRVVLMRAEGRASARAATSIRKHLLRQGRDVPSASMISRYATPP